MVTDTDMDTDIDIDRGRDKNTDTPTYRDADTNTDTDGEGDTNIHMDMDHTEIYPDGTDKPTEFCSEGYDTPINLLEEQIPRHKFVMMGMTHRKNVLFMTMQNYVKMFYGLPLPIKVHFSKLSPCKITPPKALMILPKRVPLVINFLFHVVLYISDPREQLLI